MRIILINSFKNELKIVLFKRYQEEGELIQLFNLILPFRFNGCNIYESSASFDHITSYPNLNFLYMDVVNG